MSELGLIRIESKVIKNVRKRDGSRHAFYRLKLRVGLERASHKRPVHEKAIDDLVNEIELEIVRAGGELSAARIGDMCLSGLGRIDQVAYLQFAAVYRQLGVEDVQAELDRLTPLTTDTPTPAKA